MEEMFIDTAVNLLYDIRLRIEVAVVLFEDDTTPLHRLAIANDIS